MAITSVLVGSLQQGGGLDWHAEVFPRRLLKWTGNPTMETFTVPGDGSFIALASVHVFSGGSYDTSFYMDAGGEGSYSTSARTEVFTGGVGTHYSGVVGLLSGESTRTLQVIPYPGYESPDLSYQVSIWWAELPDDLGGG